jgi:DNA-binding transcriptional LysR family regulator
MLRPTRINVSQLITFYFVGKEGNFSTAAERLCVTQPAVTKQIRALQNQFAVKLVQVKKRKVHLTEAGVPMADGDALEMLKQGRWEH